MDDMVLWSSSSENLKRILPEIKNFLSERLKLELKEPYMNINTKGVPFLGFLVKSKGIYLSGKQKRRTREKWNVYQKRLHDGTWNEREFSDHIIPLVSHLEIARSRDFRRKIVEKTGASSGQNRVNRGGSWNNNASNCRTANRNNNNPTNRNNNLGFRPARPAAQYEMRMLYTEPDTPCPFADNTRVSLPGW